MLCSVWTEAFEPLRSNLAGLSCEDSLDAAGGCKLLSESELALLSCEDSLCNPDWGCGSKLPECSLPVSCKLVPMRFDLREAV